MVRRGRKIRSLTVCGLGDNSQRIMRIRRVDDQEVLLDGNHDLAGCDLTFALQMVAIA